MTKNIRYCWAVFLFFIVVYISALNFRPMICPDEFRYAQIPIEMLQNGSWSAPRMFEMRYFEKPVFGYWITAGMFRIFGVSAFADRLGSALCAGLTALFLMIWMKENTRNDKLAALTGAIYLSFGLVLVLGTYAVLDSQLTFFTTATSLCMFGAIRENAFNRRKVLLLILAGGFAALAFMTKGFIAFAVPGLTVAACLIWEKRWKDFLVLPWIPLGTLLICAMPWVIAAHKADPDFWRYFVMVEHVERFTSSNAGQHPQPFWFFLPILIGGAFPAALLAPAAFSIGKEARKKLFRRPELRFSLCGIILPFLFFSASSGKLATYILPCFPFLAAILASAVAEYFRQGREKWSAFQIPLHVFGILLSAAGIILTVCGIGGWFSRFEYTPSNFLLSEGILLFLAGLPLLLTWHAAWRTRLYAFFLAIAVAGFSGPLIPDNLLGDKTPCKALRELADLLKVDRKRAVFVCGSQLMHAVAYSYGRSDVKVFDSIGEMRYGIEQAQKMNERANFLTHDDFRALIKSKNRPDIVYVTRSYDKKHELLAILKGSKEKPVPEIPGLRDHLREASACQIRLQLIPVF